MAAVVAGQLIWDRKDKPIGSVRYRNGEYIKSLKFFPLYVDPLPDYPAGRKGQVIEGAWKQLGRPVKASGLLLLDGDVVIDPTHAAAMMEAVSCSPDSVWTAPVRIWPVSTHRSDWVWAHWEDKASQQLDAFPRWFSFCFTYLPSELIERAIREGLGKWHFPMVDANMSRLAARAGIKAQMVEACFPIHLNY